MEIRRYTLADVDQMLDHIGNHLVDSRYKRLAYARNKMRDMLVGNARNSQFFCDLALEGDVVIAGLCAQIQAYIFSYDAIAYDHFIYVQPDKRNLKLVTTLVGNYVAWAKERKVKEVLLQNFAGAKPEKFVKLAEHLGFTFVGNIFTMEL